MSVDGRTVNLRPRTAALFSHLVRHADRVVGKNELMEVVWPDVVVTEASLVQCVKEIRQALGEHGREWIRTLPRQGYAFVANTVTPAASQTSAPASAASGPPQGGPGAHRRLQAASLVLALIVAAAIALFAWRGHQPAPPPLSIAVMPMVNLTGDAAHDAVADGMTEALGDALTRRGRISVMARSETFKFKGRAVDVRRIGAELNVRYVLEGSLRIEASRPLLMLRLADAFSAVQLWKQDFDADTGGMPALREKTIARAPAVIGLQLIRADARRSGRPGAEHAVEVMGRAADAFRSSGHTTEGMLRVRSLVEEVVRHDTELPAAWTMLALTYLPEVRFSATRDQDLRRAARAVARALALAPDSDFVRLAEGNLYYEQGRMEQALATFEHARELNPNNPAVLGLRGAALMMLGRPDEALRSIDQAMWLGPRDPQLPAWQQFAGVAHLHRGQDATAVEWLTRSVEGNPKSAFSRLFLASGLGMCGRIEDAQAQLAQFQQLRPGFTISRFRAVEPSDAKPFRAQRERFYEGLRRAGMPE